MLRLEIVGRRNLHTRIVALILQPDGGLGYLIKSFVSMQATSYGYHPVPPVDPAMGVELGKADILYNLKYGYCVSKVERRIAKLN